MMKVKKPLLGCLEFLEQSQYAQIGFNKNKLVFFACGSGGGTSGRGTAFCHSGPGLNPRGAPGSNLVFSDVINLTSQVVSAN